MRRLHPYAERHPLLGLIGQFRRRDDVDVFEQILARVGYVVPCCWRDVSEGRRNECPLCLPIDESFALPVENDQRFFVLAAGVPANGTARFQADQATTHACGLGRALQ